jgi:hypothetical protein
MKSTSTAAELARALQRRARYDEAVALLVEKWKLPSSEARTLIDEKAANLGMSTDEVARGIVRSRMRR